RLVFLPRGRGGGDVLHRRGAHFAGGCLVPGPASGGVGSRRLRRGGVRSHRDAALLFWLGRRRGCRRAGDRRSWTREVEREMKALSSRWGSSTSRSDHPGVLCVLTLAIESQTFAMSGVPPKM